MLTDPERIGREGGSDEPHRVYAKADNVPIFYGRAEPWHLIRDLPPRPVFGSLGRVEPHAPAELVRIFESGVAFQKEDYRRELPPLVIRPEGYRRILRVAWVTSERVTHTPTTPASIGFVQRIASWLRPDRLVPPLPPGAPLALRRSFTESRCDGVRFIVATWESARFPEF